MADEVAVSLCPGFPGEHIGPFREAATQSYKAGQPVYLASDKVTEVASDGVKVLGIALTDATGVTDTATYVVPIKPGDEVEITASAAPAAANIGVQYALVVANNVAKLDLTDTTNKVAHVKRLQKTPTGAASTRVIVSFIDTVLQYHIGMNA